MNNSQQNITPERMDAYHRGLLSPAEEHAIEKAALNDPLLADALEGFETHNAAALSARLRARSVGGRGWFRTLWFVPVAFLVFVCWPSSKTEPATYKSPIQTEVNTLAAPDENHQPMPEVVRMRQTDSSVQMTINHPEPVKRDKYLSIIIPREPLPEPINAKKPEPLPNAPTGLGPKQTAAKGERIYHIADYRVVDYAGRTNPPRAEGLLGGIAADREKSDSPQTIDAQETNEMAYKSLLQQSVKSFAEKRYDRCVAMMHEVLKTFPDDLNALFYGGLAEWRMGNPERAYEWLTSAQFHPIGVFREEATFYRSQCMIALGLPEGKEIMKRIAAEEGFYATRAREELAKP